MAVNTGVALVSLGARPREGEAIAAGDVVNTAAAAAGAAPVNGILVGEQTYRATRGRDRVPRGCAGGGEGRRRSRSRLWEAVEARPPLGVDLAARATDAARRTAARARSPRLGARTGERGALAAARHARRRPRHRQEPARLRALHGSSGRIASRSRGVRAAAFPTATASASGRSARWSRRRPGFWRSTAQRKPRRSCEAQSPSSSARPTRRAWVERAAAAAGRRGAARRGSVERAGEAFAAWRRFLEGLADLRPLVLVLEDLHWADEGLLDFVDELADSHPRCAAACPLHGSAGAARAAARLGRREGERAHDLAAAAVGRRDGAGRRRCARAAGARGRRARGAARAGGRQPALRRAVRARAGRGGSLEELPETVHGIIAARLDGLPPGEKALLQDAAVVGKVFWLGAIEAIGGRPASRRRSCSRAGAEGVRAAGAPLLGRGRGASTPSVTSCSATSPTVRSRARPAAKSTAARPPGSSRSAARKITPRCSPTTT